ncbi:MFS transporter [Carboxydochorda subterranea]|uniref:MFS transporter n=1 Tax=Carboxydichorda subterranea TaxID=3109565 RepID=A0ABZ1BT78_9FIRM|nr:MFS transporter [Limnochorda sp. L945t]WRP16032.1 MFS transporter [Limnochorda sp. L945t]
MDNAGRNVRVTLVASALASGLVFLGVSMTRPLLPLLLRQWGASAPTVGVTASLYALLPLVLAIPTGYWIDHVGPRRAALLGSLGLGSALAVVAAAPSERAVAFSQLLAGQGQLVVVLATQAAVVSGASGRQLERNVGLLLVSAAVVRILGPAMGGAIASRWGVLAAFAAAGATTGLAVLPSCLLESRTHAGPAGPARPALTAMARVAGWLRREPVMQATVVVTLGVLLGESVRQVFLPLVLAGRSYGPEVVGAVASAAGLGSIAARPLLGELVQAAGGRWRLAVATLAVTALCAASVPWLEDPWALGVVALVWGAASGLWPSLATVLLAERYRRDEQALALSVRLTANQLAELAGPVTAGLIASQWGLGAAFWATALVCAGLVPGITRWTNGKDEARRRA